MRVYGLVIHAWCEANEETADELEKIIDLFVKIGLSIEYTIESK